MPHILLSGAGFSRNWGGLLADEATDWLMTHPRIDDGLRDLLQRYKGKGGFEAAVDEQVTQTALPADPAERERRLGTSMMGVVGNTMMLDQAQRLDDAIRAMFAGMNEAFAKIGKLNFINSFDGSVTEFLDKFDAIFTLNQDLLLEKLYKADNASMLLHSKQWHMPGMEPIAGPPGTEIKDVKEWREMSDSSKFAVEKGSQPYFKLHGSSNWIDRSSGQPLLVIGGKKAATIGRHKILKWNNAQFEAYLSKPNTRLMIIGYSFRDEHINVAIRDAAENGTIKLFIIDHPLGADILIKNRLALGITPRFQSPRALLEEDPLPALELVGRHLALARDRVERLATQEPQDQLRLSRDAPALGELRPLRRRQFTARSRGGLSRFVLHARPP